MEAVLNGLDLFSGVGGLSLALEPWVRTVAYCENDRFAQAVLLSRMADGSLEAAPIWNDISTLNASTVDTRIDVVIGGFPCTDLSDASRGRGRGLAGDQSGLWFEMLRVIREVRPGNVFVENVDGGAWRKWLPVVRRGLWGVGYSSLPLRMRAEDVGAPFRGSRIFVAATDRYSESALPLNEKASLLSESTGLSRRDWGEPPASAMGVDDGVPFGVERRRAMGNAVVPAQAREAFKILMGLK